MYKKKLKELTDENLEDFNVSPDLFLKNKKKKNLINYSVPQSIIRVLKPKNKLIIKN